MQRNVKLLVGFVVEVLCYFLGIPKFHHMRGEEGEVFALVYVDLFLFLSMADTDREESNFVHSIICLFCSTIKWKVDEDGLIESQIQKWSIPASQALIETFTPSIF